MNKLNITIAEPCHENWNDMQANANGRHCQSCEKTVVDFTQQPREQIEQYLLQHPSEKICGRFRSTDIQTAAMVPPPAKVSWFRSRWMALAAAVSFLGVNKKAEAYVLPAVADDHNNAENKTLAPKNNHTVVHGWIRSSENNKGIAKVEIRIYSGGKEIAYSSSFANGSYFIYIPENTIWDQKITMEYNAVDYQSQILADLPAIKDRMKLDIAMMGVQMAMRPFMITTETQFHMMGGIGYEQALREQAMEYPAVERTMGAVAYQIDREYIPVQQHIDTVKEKMEEVVEPVKEFNIKTYPNPSSGIFNIALENSEGASLMVYDLSGKLILTRKVFSSLETVDLTQQPNGAYLVLLVDEASGLRKQSKVIKTS